MIDPTRWIVVEAWLSLGLRVEWAGTYDHVVAELWTPDEGGSRYVYAGHLMDKRGVWLVQPSRHTGSTVPQLSTEAMKHELAHWLTSSPEQRKMANFGLTGRSGTDDTPEDRAGNAERVIDAMIAASARIVSLALGGRP